jgi:hypothetical protein
MRRAMPPRLKTLPARTKSGSARNGKLSRPEVIRWVRITNGVRPSRAR